MSSFPHVDKKKLAQILAVSDNEVENILNTGQIPEVAKTPKPALNEQTPSVAPFLQENNITIYHEDFILSDSLLTESIDLIVTSPPYNVGIEYGQHDDTDEYAQYLDFNRKWLSKAYALSAPSGRMCLNIPLDKNKGGQQSVGSDITQIAKEIGWSYHSTIIWNEGNISRRTAWGSWMSASAPYIIAPVEVIVVLYKGVWKKQNPHKRENDISRDEFMEWTNGVWTFNGESKKRIGHPAPFPRELPKRCIKLFSFVGDTVLDPFVGSGTTLLEASTNNRLGIGFDLDHNYCQLAEKRLRQLWQSGNQLNLI